MKKLFVLLSILVLCLLIFSACGEKQLSDDKQKEQENNHSTTSSFPGVSDPDYSQCLFNATENAEQLSGSPLEIIVGENLRPSYAIDQAPPAFEFPTRSVVVRARVIESYDSIYQKLEVQPNYTPAQYRIIKMETEEVLRGENIPSQFLYLLPSHLFVDMSVYDTLLVAMTQIGTENYVIVNKTQNKVESLALPLFKDYQEQPELGSIIAFTDGIFDESLWQTPSWIYGYQFGRHYLEHEELYDLVVSRGCTLQAAISNVNERISSSSSPVPSLISLSSISNEVTTALEYVKPFENGVFYQSLKNDSVIFRRYINGCRTDETVEINFKTGKVTYSEDRYSQNDLASIENIAHHIYEKSEAYRIEHPNPPHVSIKDKDLIFLSVFGWYEKVDDKVYGVIKTTWQYKDFHLFYDDSYILYFPNADARIVSNDRLIAIIGDSHYIYHGDYSANSIYE
ncbi:MAG: hypothetical protein J6B45_05225 [Clostridia bacterium]|nr:hypothetical protein [Clostridia bacterium]